NEILRCYAGRCGQAPENDPGRRDAWDRLCRHLVSLSEEALHVLDPHRHPARPTGRSGSFDRVEDALAWLRAERANLAAVAARAAEVGPQWAASSLAGILATDVDCGYDAPDGLAVLNSATGGQV